ncbi:hypothetical protein Tco_1086738 [Tanacetum coccineum]
MAEREASGLIRSNDLSHLSANAVNRSIGTELPRPESGTYMAIGRISFEELRVNTPNTVKDNKIDLLVQQYEQFTILEEESIDSGFARFNTIITSLKALDEGFFSKNYVRKFLRALHPKWRAKVMAIEESKDLSSLALD